MTAPMDTTTSLALALDGAIAPTNDEIVRLTGIAGIIEQLPDPEIDSRFAARLEATLMAEFDAQHESANQPLRIVKPVAAKIDEPKVAPNVIAFPHRRVVIRKMVAAAIAAAMISALPIIASASALPGSPFFGIEQWRQNNTISSAHGVHRAFIEESIARKWIGYSAEMVTLQYSADRIDRALRHAGWLQFQAVSLVAKIGAPADVTRLAGLLNGDAIHLKQIHDKAPVPTKPFLGEAIDAVSQLMRTLYGVPNAISLPASATLDAAVSLQDAPAPAEVSPQSQRQNDTGSTKAGSKSAKAPSATQLPDSPVDVGEICAVPLRDKTGDLLTPVSKTQCVVRDKIQHH